MNFIGSVDNFIDYFIEGFWWFDKLFLIQSNHLIFYLLNICLKYIYFFSKKCI